MAASLVLAAIVVTGVIVAVRAEGFEAADATVPRATRWLLDESTGRIVLADGFAGRTLARLDTGTDGAQLSVRQSAAGAAVVDRASATVRMIDAAALRLGPPQPLAPVAAPGALVGVGQAGIIAVDPGTAQAALLPPDGEQLGFDLARLPGTDPAATQIAPDGSVWTVAGGVVDRTTSTGAERIADGLDDARMTLVGNLALILDVGQRLVRLGDGRWLDLPAGVPLGELVIQESGPSAECGWVGGDDRLWCVGEGGVEHEVTIAGLDIDGSDRLAIAGDAAVVVRRSSATVERIDWRRGQVIAGDGQQVASVPTGAQLDVAVSVDLVWIEQVDGPLVWSVHPWGINVFRKDDASSPLLGQSGDVIEPGSPDPQDAPGPGGTATGDTERLPDDNGIDDPPVAVDDAVTARTGAGVPVIVTANDFDPDGEPIVVTAAGRPADGTVEIASGSTIVYRPNAGYVGRDTFDYTIVDGNGSSARATVTIDLVPVDAVNRAPSGSADRSETSEGVPVVIDVLANDVDPERDGLRIGSFTPADIGGQLTETVAASGLPGLRFEPTPGTSGTATFTYRPADVLGAVGEAVTVTVEIAQPGDDNRPPIVRPDSVRARTGIPGVAAVLANDRDPDGDRLRLTLERPMPPGITASVDGESIEFVARAGTRELSSIAYVVDDGRGHRVTGTLLVALIADDQPNRPPIANADMATVVAGTTATIDVLLNDSDPDGDPVVLMSAGDAELSGTARVEGRRVRYTAPSALTEATGNDRFTYVISDGNGHESRGEVSVRLIGEPIAAPPFARDDAATTQVDQPVTLDVLRNDGDPSGERPSIVGTPGCAGGGTALLAADERVTFTPPAGADGVFSCSYEVTNSQELRARATIVVSVLRPPTANSAPVVTDEELTVRTDSTTTVDLLLNDRDPDGPSTELEVLSSTTPALGTAQRVGNSITFSAGPTPGATVITYQVGDAHGGVGTGRLVIRIVEPVPLAPIAVDDRRVVVAPVSTTIIDVLANDVDPDATPTELSLASVTYVAGSGRVAAAGRSLALTPNADFVGELIADYVVVDADGLTDTGRVVLVVTAPPNRPPVAGDDAAEVANGGTISVPIADNDVDPDGDPLTYAIASGPEAGLGSARLRGPTLVFEAVPGATGLATVQYTVSDGASTASATVRIRVLACGASAPVAPDLFLQTGYQQPISVDLTTLAVNGEVVDVGAPLLTATSVYTPPPGENGNVVVSYTVRNTCGLQATGTVTIDVNQDPSGSPYSATISRAQPLTIPVSALASDTEPLTITALESSPGWIAVAGAGSSIAVDPTGQAGTASATAVIADPGGLVVRVPITIVVTNLAPLGQPDVARATGGVVELDPLANDADPDGDVLTLQDVPTSVTFSDGTTVAVERVGNTLRVDPAGASGSATFTYRAVDPFGAVSSPVSVTIDVNAPPTVAPLEVALVTGAAIDVPITAVDPEGDAVTIAVVGDPSPLTVTIAGMVATISAPDGALGVFVVDYTATDAFGASALGQLSVSVVES